MYCPPPFLSWGNPFQVQLQSFYHTGKVGRASQLPAPGPVSSMEIVSILLLTVRDWIEDSFLCPRRLPSSWKQPVFDTYITIKWIIIDWKWMFFIDYFFLSRHLTDCIEVQYVSLSITHMLHVYFNDLLIAFFRPVCNFVNMDRAKTLRPKLVSWLAH